jgi:poly(hydroxyalkanoate) depolymerase family esterase
MAEAAQAGDPEGIADYQALAHGHSGSGVEPAAPRPGRAAGQFIDGSYSNRAGTRHYKLYIPASYVGQPVPLIGMLHGCTQPATDLAAGTRMNLLAEEHTFLVVYPQQSSHANRATCWTWWRESDQQRGAGEPSLIAGITQEIMARYRVDPRRVYLAGVSAGGALAAIMGATYPDLYAAIGVHSGIAYGAARSVLSGMAAMRRGREGRVLPAARRHNRATVPARFVPLILFQGDRDTVVHRSNGDWVIDQWLDAYKSLTGATRVEVREQSGAVPGGRTYSQTLYQASGGYSLMEQWTIHGADHGWSGGSPQESWTDPHGPDASREMVRFFLGHPQ